MPRFVQPTLFDMISPADYSIPREAKLALESISNNSDSEVRGAIYTRTEVVEFILDLVGYVVDKPLYQSNILEPSFGNGDFLFPIVERIIESWKNRSECNNINDLKDSIFAVELHKKSFENTRYLLIKKLIESDFSEADATELADGWLFQGDFLLEAPERRFDFIVGNPPYIRQEMIPTPLLNQYRIKFRTMYDRADLYVPFIEKSLTMLRYKAVLGFICADRWTKNKYGGPLRKMISDEYGLLMYVDMFGTNAFLSEVSAYPAITIISKQKTLKTRVLKQPMIERQSLLKVASEIKAPILKEKGNIKEIKGVLKGTEPWILESAEDAKLVRRLEVEFPTLEEAGCRVGIGVATGADKAFISKYDSLDIELDRKLPLVRTRDIKTGEIIWQGDGVVNPFDNNGELVNLAFYPKLRNYLNQNKSLISNRHCVKKNPAKWYRTIDRIRPQIAYTPKLLIPDIKNEAHIVFEAGIFYPHHNLYYVTSDDWDLRALQAVLLSFISKFFVSRYSTKMRGGYLRFQAQYIRRIRLPFWKDIPESLRLALIKAGTEKDIASCNELVYGLYRLNSEEKIIAGAMENIYGNKSC